VHHPPVGLVLLDTLHPNSGQPEQQGRTLTHARGLSGLLRRNSKPSRGHGLINSGAPSKARNRALPGQVPRAGLALFGDMTLAMITVTWATGFNSISSPPGYQLNLALAVLALVAALIGAGRFGLDALVARALGRGRTVDSLTGDFADARTA
jgi:hypothetical protein